MLRRFEQHLIEQDWQEVQAGVEVKVVPGPEGDETFVLARSQDRRQKERAMRDRFQRRMEEGLERMARSASTGRLKDAGKAHQRLGRLKQRNWRAASAFEVKIEEIPTATTKARLRITWKRNPRWSDWSALSEGCYLLRTNLPQTDPRVLWKQYIQLTEAEWAFRITKDELGIRPIWHQKAERVEGHILVCFLAYAMWKTLAQWMKGGGLGDAPRSVVEEFAGIKSGDVVLPAQTPDGHGVRLLRLRCVSRPDGAQRVLLSRLGLNLPERLRWVEDVGQPPQPKEPRKM
jgi:transposase